MHLRKCMRWIWLFCGKIALSVLISTENWGAVLSVIVFSEIFLKPWEIQRLLVQNREKFLQNPCKRKQKFACCLNINVSIYGKFLEDFRPDLCILYVPIHGFPAMAQPLVNCIAFLRTEIRSALPTSKIHSLIRADGSLSLSGFNFAHSHVFQFKSCRLKMLVPLI